jgi:hypothetical protein
MASLAVLEPTAPAIALPTFDLHKVEEALRTNHRLFNGTPMTEEEIQEAVLQYRHFLANHKLKGMPERFEVPSRVIDRVWHTHMCETQQYADDCQAYFGKFVHHRSEICDGGGAGQPGRVL